MKTDPDTGQQFPQPGGPCGRPTLQEAEEKTSQCSNLPSSSSPSSIVNSTQPVATNMVLKRIPLVLEKLLKRTGPLGTERPALSVTSFILPKPGVPRPLGLCPSKVRPCSTPSSLGWCWAFAWLVSPSFPFSFLPP